MTARNEKLHATDLRTPTRTRNALFAAIGIALLLAAVLMKDRFPDAREILFNVGIVALSVSLLDLLWRLAGGNPVEVQIALLSDQVTRLSRSIDIIERARKVGLTEMYDCTGNFGGKGEWFKLLASANNSMDLMGRTLHEWIRAPELDDIVISKIQLEGVRFRWLLMSKGNRHLKQLEEDGEQIGEVITKKIDLVCRRLTDIRSRLPAEKRDHLKIRLFERMPLYCSVLRVDDRYLVTPYLQNAASRNAPLLTISGRNTPWAIAYDREFEVVWSSAADLPDVS